MRRLLVVNPNTSEAVTAAFLAEARLAVPAGVTLDGVTGNFGAAIVSTLAEEVIAAHSALTLIAHHAPGYDGVILAISFDSGLAAGRELLPVPVVGITRAALEAAPPPVGVVFFGEVSRPLYHRLIAEVGVPVMGLECVAVTGAQDYLVPEGRDAAALAAAERLRAQGAASVVLCGAAIVGMARRLQPALAIPVLDGAAPAVAAVLSEAPGPARPRPLGPVSGIDPALAALIGSPKAGAR